MQASLESSFTNTLVDRGYLACHADADCVGTPVNQSGWCVAACGALGNKASADAIVAAADEACAGFDAQCSMPAPQCPRSSSPPLCVAGGCTTYEVSLSPPSPSLTHGTCAALAAVFSTSYPTATDPAEAPHDIPVTLTANGGTLYADEACTTPLGPPSTTTMGATATVTIHGGSSRVAFGFEPQDAGSCSISVDGLTTPLSVK